ncbi:hypothetical protein FVEN_g2127 [Fusarium venenatum]|uniref:Uncharacterized protein n=2 Tax=Fusarium venenatum TaxID=56646 RepID=A0A2L2T3M9_9HYPO|nr:uncharacterized protein FVRRES_12540 [Fusarium venenatum]KAG8360114.1 hypothetical protein FVEN_g2127 [Fusarium venenatum]CEI39849.1 unnamed protein product [Fusarium venenatum]
MPSSRTQSGLKAASEKSSKFLSTLKEAVRSTFSSNSESSNEEKGREKHRYKLQERPDLRSSQEEADWAYVHQEVLADCVPDKSPDKYRADQGMTLERYRAIADQDQLFCGPYRPPMDSPEAVAYGVQLRDEPRRHPMGERKVAARVRQFRAEAAYHEHRYHVESRRHAMKEREAAARRRQPRDEIAVNEEQFDAESRRYTMDERQGSASSSSSVYESETEAREAQLRAEAQLRVEAQLRADSARRRRMHAEAVARVDDATRRGRMRAEAAAREDELRPETRRFIN